MDTEIRQFLLPFKDEVIESIRRGIAAMERRPDMFDNLTSWMMTRQKDLEFVQKAL